MMERKFPFIFVPRTKVPWSESSQKRKFSGTNVPYWELLLPGVKVPKSEKAIIPNKEDHRFKYYIIMSVTQYNTI